MRRSRNAGAASLAVTAARRDPRIATPHPPRVVVALLSAGTAFAQSGVLAPGNPPLTRAMVDRVIGLMGEACEAAATTLA
jgi:hypothetical protein